jgi:hypothetical protein
MPEHFTTRTVVPKKTPDADMIAFNTAMKNNDKVELDRIKIIYQMAGGNNADTIEEIQWHSSAQFHRKNPLS